MALLKFAADKLEELKRPEEGWYVVEITNVIDEMSKPKEGKVQSLNCFGDVTLITRLADGKDVSHMGKRKPKMFLFNYEWFHLAGEFLCAALDIPNLDVLRDKEIDMSAAMDGAQLHARVKHDIYKKNPSDAGTEVWEFCEYMPTSRVPF